jgi:hypothetical protein
MRESFVSGDRDHDQDSLPDAKIPRSGGWVLFSPSFLFICLPAPVSIRTCLMHTCCCMTVWLWVSCFSSLVLLSSPFTELLDGGSLPFLEGRRGWRAQGSGAGCSCSLSESQTSQLEAKCLNIMSGPVRDKMGKYGFGWSNGSRGARLDSLELLSGMS